jgi:hypothetical protein
LEAIKWWGGWSQGEKLGAISKYLLENYNKLEGTYGDMLSPTRRDRNLAIFETNEDEPVSKALFSGATNSILEKLDEIMGQINCKLPEGSNVMPAIQASKARISIRNKRQSKPTTPTASHNNEENNYIPQLLMKIPKIVHWLDAVKQYNEGLPSLGIKPLKNFSLRERNPTGLSKKELTRIKSIFSRRKKIALEYNLLGDERFRDTYSSSLHKVDKLLSAIRKQIAERKSNSCNDNSSI